MDRHSAGRLQYQGSPSLDRGAPKASYVGPMGAPGLPSRSNPVQIRRLAMGMHTVYGIYEAGSDVALYVGATHLPLNIRFTGHLTTGKNLLLRGSKTAGETSMLKAEWMRRHLVGETVLEMRPISRHRTRKVALAKERETIFKLKPILNSSKPRTYRRRGMDVLRGERVPEWYIKHLADAERDGIPAVRIARFDATIERLKNEPQAAA